MILHFTSLAVWCPMRVTAQSKKKAECDLDKVIVTGREIEFQRKTLNWKWTFIEQGGHI